MTLFSASFGVAPSGTAIPLTGGTDGFTDGNNTAGSTFVSDSSFAPGIASGTYAGKITIGATAGSKVWREWTWSGSIVHVRQYIYLTAAPNVRFTLWENRNGTTEVSRIRLGADLTLGMSSSGSPLVSTVAAIPLNTLVRVEASFDHVAGTMSLSSFVGHDTTPITDGTLNLTGRVFSSSTITAVRGGVTSGLTNFTLHTDEWAVSDVSRRGPAVPLGSVITGVTPTAQAQAVGGSVQAVVGATVTIAGVTPQVVAQGGDRPLPPPPPVDPGWPPDPYREVIRHGGYSLYTTVDASIDGVPVEGATGMAPLEGSTVTDTSKPGVRRVLSLSLAAEPGLYDLLAPVGTRLKVTTHIRYQDQTVLDIPMGVFGIDVIRHSIDAGTLSITAPDKWAEIQRARFIGPLASNTKIPVLFQIAELIRGVFGWQEPVQVSASNNYTFTPALVWEKDRDKAINDLAKSIGAWVYFDRDGIATIADVPSIGDSADWLVDASESGVLINLDREKSRADTRNVVVVSSSASEGELFPVQVAWDADEASPTYAGHDPMNAPEAAAAFGISTYYYDTPLPLTAEGAYRAGRTILSRVVGLVSQVTMEQLPNPAMDSFAILDVLPPRERYDIVRTMERHIADSLTHSLTGGPLQIAGRSTRAEELDGGA